MNDLITFDVGFQIFIHAFKNIEVYNKNRLKTKLAKINL